jgi:hypothetical protein
MASVLKLSKLGKLNREAMGAVARLVIGCTCLEANQIARHEMTADASTQCSPTTNSKPPQLEG